MIVWWHYISCGLWGEGTDGGDQIFGDQGIDSMAKWWEGQWDDLGLGGCWVLWGGGGDLLSIMGDTLSLAWVSRCWTHTRNPLAGGGSPLVGWWNKTGVAIFLQNIGETVLFWGKRKATKAAIGYTFFCLQFSLSENIRFRFFTMEVGNSTTFPLLPDRNFSWSQFERFNNYHHNIGSFKEVLWLIMTFLFAVSILLQIINRNIYSRKACWRY